MALRETKLLAWGPRDHHRTTTEPLRRKLLSQNFMIALSFTPVYFNYISFILEQKEISIFGESAISEIQMSKWR